jgi:hypothetical protein
MKSSEVRCHICKDIIQIGRHTVVSTVNTVKSHGQRIYNLERDKPQKTMWNGYNTKTDYSIDGFFDSVKKTLHHWFVFYLTATIILASIFVPLIILAIIGNAVG